VSAPLPDEPGLTVARLAETWAAAASQTTYLPMSGDELGQLLTRLINRLLTAVAAAPMDRQVAAEVARRCPGVTVRLAVVAVGGSRLAVDAAGLLDPITREGIYFALRSGELAAQAMAASDGGRARREYGDAIQDEIVTELRRAANYKARFFQPRFTGLLVDALAESDGIRRVMARLVAGNPLPAAVEEPARFHITFLATSPAADRMAALEPGDFAPDQFRFGDRALSVWYRDGVLASKLSNDLLERRLGVVATSRNWNTVTTLLELAQATQGGGPRPATLRRSRG